MTSKLMFLFLCFLVWPYNKHLINWAKSVCIGETLDLGRWYRSHCVQSVLGTLVKILPYRPPAQLIRAKYKALLWELRACLHGDGGPHIGEVTRFGGVTHLSI